MGVLMKACLCIPDKIKKFSPLSQPHTLNSLTQIVTIYAADNSNIRPQNTDRVSHADRVFNQSS